MDDNKKTLGKVISERRYALGYSLKDLGEKVQKENGQRGVSAQYLHDIERDRRTPSPHVLGALSKALGIDVHYLGAVAGQCPDEVIQYLKGHPEAAPAVATLFARARATGFDAWGDVEFTPKSARAAAR